MYTQETLKAEIIKRISADPIRTIKFADCTMVQKIETLAKISGVSIEAEKEYKVNDSLKIEDYKTANDFYTAISKVADFPTAMAVMNEGKTAYEFTTIKKGKNLSQKQTISVLTNVCAEKGLKVDTEKFEVDVLGGANFVAMMEYIRSLSEDDFKALISK